MLSVCSRCRLRLAAQAPTGTRGYVQSIDQILESPARDELTSAIDPIKGAKRSRGPGYHSTKSRAENGQRERRELFRPRTSKAPGAYGFTKTTPHSSTFTPSLQGILGPEDVRLEAVNKLLDAAKYREAWAHCLQLFDTYEDAALTDVRQSNEELLRSGLKLLFKSYKAAWWRSLLREQDVPDIPSPSEMRSDLQNRLPLADDILAVHALFMASLSAKYNPQSAMFNSPVHNALFTQLMDFWAAWIKDRREGPPEDYASAYSVFPLDDGVQPTERNNNRYTDTGSYMTTIIPEFRRKSDKLPMVDLALCLVAVLRKATARSELRPELEVFLPFMEDMSKILQASSLRFYKQKFSAALDQVGVNEATIGGLINLLQHSAIAPAETLMAQRLLNTDLTLGELSLRIITSLARYRERSNLDLVEQSWDMVKTKLEALSDSDKTNLSSHRIYEEFLYTFRTLRRADHAVQVWNHMIANGFRPTVRTWNVMLKGCHIGKEVDNMEMIWKRMREAGIRPDSHSWGIRIHGLFQFRKINEGYRALTEMTETADRWKPTPGDEDPPPRPDTVILNSALSGLARYGTEPVRTVLAWASGQRIKLDIITYNILINISVHTGKKEDARQLMQRMAAEGISPDPATFTILLHSVFRDGFLSDLDPAQQEEHAMEFIRSIEADGLSLDVRGYALLLDRLLKECRNVKATKVVLDHMVQRGITPTAHMYTILMTHYFSLDPPDIEAVETLWEGIKSKPNYVVDVIFYDRMLEGFARADKVTKMMYFLQRMGQEGKRPGWMALIEVLRCLKRKGDFAGAKGLVRDVELSEGYVKAGVRGRKGYDEFWALARELLDE